MGNPRLDTGSDPPRLPCTAGPRKSPSTTLTCVSQVAEAASPGTGSTGSHDQCAADEARDDRKDRARP